MLYPQQIELSQEKALSRFLSYPSGLQAKFLDVDQEMNNLYWEFEQLRREITMAVKETGEIPFEKQRRLEEIQIIFEKR